MATSKKAVVVKAKEPVKQEALVSYDAKRQYLQVGNSVKDLIESLPTMPNEQLTGLFRNTVDAERAMFVVRGATAHELIKRADEEGKKFNKTAGGGIDTMIEAIAKDVGIDGKTLYADYRVFKEFGGLLVEQLTTAPDTIMPREFYVLASKTASQAIELPSVVLEYFQEQRESTGGYFTDQARRDTKLFNEGKSVEEVKKLDAQVRKEKVALKATAPAKLPAEQTTMVKITANKQNVAWYKQIIEKYGSFNEWYVRKCKEEFGGGK